MVIKWQIKLQEPQGLSEVKKDEKFEKLIEITKQPLSPQRREQIIDKIILT